MGKLVLLLADFDYQYLKRLEDYIMMRYSMRFDIYSFTNQQKLEAFLKESPKIADVLLASPLIVLNANSLEKVHTVLKLLDTPTRDDMVNDHVYKYMHAELIIKDILKLHSLNCNTDAEQTYKRKTSIIAVNSSCGGSGKSIIAASLGMMAARRGMRIFYLSLESMPSACVYFRGRTDRNFSDIIYYLKENESNLLLKLEGACSYDTASGVYFFLPPDSVIQMEELDKGDLERLLKAFRAVSLFDIVIIDMADGVNQKNLFLLTECDAVIKVCLQGVSSKLKDELYVEAISKLENDANANVHLKTVYVLNKYIDSMQGKIKEGNAEDKYDIVIRESEKLRNYSGEALIADVDPAFSAVIARLLDKSLAIANERFEGGIANEHSTAL